MNVGASVRENRCTLFLKKLRIFAFLWLRGTFSHKQQTKRTERTKIGNFATFKTTTN